MSQKKQVSVYKRDPVTRGQVLPYSQKFSGLIELCEKSKTNGVGDVVITWPWIIGDTYEEIVESLSRFAEAKLVLHIVERGPVRVDQN